MSPILIISITIRLVAMGCSIVLLRRIRNWYMGFLTVLLGLMIVRQLLALLTENEPWKISVTDNLVEFPGLVVSIMVFLAIFILERIVSERKQAKDHIQHLQSVLMAIRNINQLIVHEKNQKELLQGACDILNHTSDYKFIWVGLIEESTKEVLPVAQAGFEEGYLNSIRITCNDSGAGNGPTGTAIKTKKPSIMRDIATDNDYKPWKEEAMKRGYASSVAVPLIYEERIFGALNVYATVPDAFDGEELDLLLEVSQDVAFALHNFEIEAEKKRTEEFLQNIIDNTSDLVCTVDLEGNFLSINKAVTEQTGYEKEDLIGKSKTKLAVEPELFTSTFKKVLENGSISNLEVPFRKKDGTIADILYSMALLRDKNANPFAVAGFGKDITKRKQAEKALRESNRKLTILMDNLPGMAYRCKNDRDWTMEFISEGCTALTGYETTDLIFNKKLSYNDLIHPEEQETVWNNVQKALEQQTSFQLEYRIITANNTVNWVWARGQGIHNLKGELIAIEGLITDITDRKLAEEELQKGRDENTKLAVVAKERSELQDWINTFDTFVGKFDPDGLGIIFNEAPLKAGGVTGDDVVGKYFPDVKWWSHSKIERARIVECFKKAKAGLASRIESNFRSADGTPVPIIFNCQPVMDDDGKVNYITAEGKTIIEETQLRTELQEAKKALEIRVRERTAELVEAIDKLKKEIAERKRVEEELRKYQEQLEELVKERTGELEEKTTDLQQANIRLQELDRLKSMFIASMSHELRTPLNSIIGFTGIMLQGMVGEITAEQRKQLTMVKNSGTHLLSLINDVIDVSKIEAGKVELSIEEFNLSDLMKEVKDSFKVVAAEKGLKISLETPKQLLIKNEKRRTKQILLNLLSNAVKFTDRGQIAMKLEKKDGKAVVSVKDTGIGIRKEDMGKLFKAFSQVYAAGRPKQEGTGLGIYLSKRIADLLGCEIKVTSKVGTGSKFTFTLPLKYKEPSK